MGTYRIEWKKSALRELKRLDRQVVARIIAAVREASELIRVFPLMCRLIEADLRQCRVMRFPYGLIYRLRGEEIQIVAVMHLHREPGYWKWHSSQEFRTRDGGRMEMRIRTTGRKEMVRWILSWMPDVKVLAPKSLRDRIVEKLRDGLRAQQ